MTMRLWAEKLRSGETVQFRPRGNSMVPKIHSGDLVTVTPDVADIQEGDIVLCKVNGHYYVHLVRTVSGGRFQIANNRGRVNGWIGQAGIFGKVVQVTP